MIPIHIVGLFYAIFFLKEVKEKPKIEDAAYDNPVAQTELPNLNHESTLQIEVPSVERSKNACLEFFDPQLAKHCIKSFLKKREYGIRSIIMLLMLMHFITQGVTAGEAQNLVLYQRIKLGWDIGTNTYHNVFAIVMGLIGTLLMIGVLSKCWKVPDIVLTLISTALTTVSRFVYSVVTNTIGFFVGTAIDFTFSVKFLGTRALISKLVPSEDLSTMFAIMGLCEAFAGLIFPFIYPTFYQYLLDSNRDVADIFYLSITFFMIAFITYS